MASGAGKKRRRRQRLTDMRGWLSVAGVAVTAVIAGCLVVAAFLQTSTPTASSYQRPVPTGSSLLNPAEPERIPTIVFIGDSWLGGTGADPSGPANGYAGLATAALGWNAKYLTGGGTGYTTGNQNGEGPFGDRVQTAIETSPDIVVVQGSSNDFKATGDEVRAAANEVFARLRAGIPNAKIIALGSIDSPSSPDDRLAAGRTGVSEAALANGVTFVDGNQEGWLDVSTDFADGYHPNNTGHQKVADRLVERLRAARQD